MYRLRLEFPDEDGPKIEEAFAKRYTAPLRRGDIPPRGKRNVVARLRQIVVNTVLSELSLQASERAMKQRQRQLSKLFDRAYELSRVNKV